jgi:segregation and condensation protein B
MDDKIAELEALLFVHGEPLPFVKITKLLGMDDASIRALLGEYEKRLAASDRGLGLVMSEDRVQLTTKPVFARIVESFIKAELAEELSPASLEALAIVGYFGPISRARIDYQRGVNSQFILRSLLLRGLVERSPDPHRPNAYLYAPSFELLKHLGVSRQSDLPEYAKFHSLLERFEASEGTGDVAVPVAGAVEEISDSDTSS